MTVNLEPFSASATIEEANERLRLYARRHNQKLRMQQFDRMTKNQQQRYEAAGWSIEFGWKGRWS